MTNDELDYMAELINKAQWDAQPITPELLRTTALSSPDYC